MLVCHVIGGLGDGGAEAVLYRLCRFPQPRHRHLVIALGSEDKYGPMLREAGVDTYCLGWPPGRISLRGAFALVRLLRRHSPDAVQTWLYHSNLVGALAARLTRCPNVIWGLHHTELSAATTAAHTRAAHWLCARLSSIVPSGIVACAEQVRVVHQRQGYRTRRFMVITNGCDTATFRPDPEAGHAIRRDLGIDPRTPVIGCVGRWHADKDHVNLLAAFAVVARHMPDVRLLLVGKGCVRENADLQSRLERNGIAGRVHLLGPRHDIAAVMNAVDLHVLSSRSEAFPNVVTEAMACGTPCVVTDVGDAAAITGTAGWTVPPGDPTRLAGAILQAFDERRNPEVWTARQALARQRVVEQFSIERMVEGYHAAWAGV